MRPGIAIVAAILSTVGCSSGPVTIEGIAANAKSGAQIVTSDKCVNLKGKLGWPEKVVGKKVRATGNLTSFERPEPKVEDPEETPQGPFGTIWELRDYIILEDGR